MLLTRVTSKLPEVESDMLVCGSSWGNMKYLTVPSPPPDTKSLVPLPAVAAVAGRKAAHLAKCLCPMHMLRMEGAPYNTTQYSVATQYGVDGLGIVM